jgi:maltose alpha-D-glucosyltransferase/alpha-amylase
LGTNPPTPSLWYRDAIIYELHVRSFYDSNGDGIGDFPGLTEKLDYLRDLGITAIWLLPHYPSPLKDGGYDIADYKKVHPDYGTLGDFKTFVREAHQRGLKVITELVLNHTSDQHPWFQRAAQADTGSPARNFYVWSDTPDRYRDARIIFKDFEPSNWAWNPTAGAYYWHRFYAHQPDLNYDNPAVRRAMTEVVDFWLRLGVDGLRLDAVPYLYEREGTSCENLPETHAFLKQLRRHVDRRFPNRMLLAEANQWPEEAVAYFGDGDECHMAFHFPLMPRLFMAIRTGDCFPIYDIQDQTPPIPETCQWAMFLRNHDELTLEMVTEEERLYMYRIYAQAPEARINLGIRRRLAPLMHNDRRRIELMNMLLFSLSGTPVIYYGDELGMGDNIYLGDRDGVRTPMQWSADRNAGFSRAHPQQLYLPLIVDPEYHHATIHVEAQQNNPSSVLWFMKRLIALRKRYRAFGRGSFELLNPSSNHVLAFIRRSENERILVVANLSRYAQMVHLDLAEFRGVAPVELLGHTSFPPIGEQPYALTVGANGLYWFALEHPSRPRVRRSPASQRAPLPAIAIRRTWEEVVLGEARNALELILPTYLQGQRWFGGKARKILSTHLVDAVAVPYRTGRGYLALVRVDYTEADSELYMLPLTMAPAARAGSYPAWARVACLRREGPGGDEAGILVDAFFDPEFSEALVKTGARRLKGAAGEVVAAYTPAFRKTGHSSRGAGSCSVAYAEHSNTTAIHGERLTLKLYRRLDIGIHPEPELGRLLTRNGYTAMAPLVGTLTYRRERAEPMSLAILHRFTSAEGDAWALTLEAVEGFFERALAASGRPPRIGVSAGALMALAAREAPEMAQELIGPYLRSAGRLGAHTAGLHCALAAATQDPSVHREPFSRFYQRSRYQAMRGLTSQVLHTLRRRLDDLPRSIRRSGRRVLEREDRIVSRFRWLLDRTIPACRIRCHGNYHLQQVLCRGEDFAVIDFEGEPRRPLGERRLKRSPLHDVASMLRSFDYAARRALADRVGGGAVRARDRSNRQQWARFWRGWVCAAFLREYAEIANREQLVPSGREFLIPLLDVYLLERAIYELGYELEERPEWIEIPLLAILELLDARSDGDHPRGRGSRS